MPLMPRSVAADSCFFLRGGGGGGANFGPTIGFLSSFPIFLGGGAVACSPPPVSPPLVSLKLVNFNRKISSQSHIGI